MDYLKVYNDSYEYFHNENIELISKHLKQAKNINTKFEYIFRNISRIIHANFLNEEKNFILKMNKQIFYEVISNAEDYFSKNSIEGVLHYTIKDSFDSLSLQENGTFTNYKDFIKSLANQVACIDILEIINSKKRILNVLYQIDKVEEFNFSGGSEYSQLENYTETFNTLFPENKEENKEEIDSNLLSENDKCLLIYFLLNMLRENDKPTTIETARIITLANINDPLLLTKNYKNSQGYKILTTGSSSKNNKKKQIEWIKELLKKIKPYNLTTTNSKLKIHLSKLQQLQK